ncbi:MAG: DUF4365 domain-containing protein [Sphingobacteriaceae bacterium]|nr:MAG: DUF4365 domain-containing protein [Sphingobacteriaceae bacterium]
MKEFPSRAPSHLLEEKSDRFFRKYLPISWVINKPIDYGLDYYIEIADDQAVNGVNFSVQLKAHEILTAKKEVIVTLKRTTVNMYLNRLEPILLLCYIDSEQEAYYDWFKENTVDLTKNHESYSIKINKSNKITKLNWSEIVIYVKKVFSRKFLLNVLPEIDFSEIPDGDEKIAAAYYVKGEFENAEQAYKKLLLKETKITWLSALAMCQYSLYRYQEALININQALELSDMLELWINKASILAEDGIISKDKAKLLEAKSIFHRAISTFDDAHYCYNYANTLSELGEYALAETFYKKAIKKNPNYAETWKNLGEIYFRTHRHEKERLCYENALKINPDLPEAIMSLGIYLIRSNEHVNEGLTLMHRAVELAPNLFFRFQMAYFWFAYANIKLDQEEEALSYLKKGLNLSPGNVYLLNLKRDYLNKHWQENENAASNYIAFLNYRLDLNASDLESFSLLVEAHLLKKHIGEALKLIQLNTGLLQTINESFISKYAIPLQVYMSALPSYTEYAYFRQQHPVERYGPFDYDENVIPIVELVSFGLFHNAITFCKKNRTRKNKEREFSKITIDYAAEHFPICAPLMITRTKEEIDLIGQEIAEAILVIPEIALREAGLVIGHVGHMYNLNNTKLDNSLTDNKEKTNFSEILANCLTTIQERHHIFRDDEEINS